MQDGPPYPGLQAAHSVDAVVTVVKPVGQTVQAAGPITGLKKPMSHGVQLGGVPVYPALQMLQSLADVAPVPGVVVPEVQMVQLTAPAGE